MPHFRHSIEPVRPLTWPTIYVLLFLQFLILERARPNAELFRDVMLLALCFLRYYGVFPSTGLWKAWVKTEIGQLNLGGGDCSNELWGAFQTFDLVNSIADKQGDVAAAFWLLRNRVPRRSMSTSTTILSWATDSQSVSNELSWQKSNHGIFTFMWEDIENVDLQWPSTKYASNPSGTISKYTGSPISPREHKILREKSSQWNKDLQQDKSPLLLHLYLFQSK